MKSKKKNFWSLKITKTNEYNGSFSTYKKIGLSLFIIMISKMSKSSVPKLMWASYDDSSSETRCTCEGKFEMNVVCNGEGSIGLYFPN